MSDQLKSINDKNTIEWYTGARSTHNVHVFSQIWINWTKLSYVMCKYS